MELFIDFNKSLDMGKLVKRQVQVKGKNGKIFSRMQWVNPHDASTGHGVRHITSEKGLHEAMKDGVDKHPSFHHALKDQAVDMDNHDFDKHVGFHVPETKESAESFHSREGNEGRHIGHGGVDTHEQKRINFALHEHDAHPELNTLKQTVSKVAELGHGGGHSKGAILRKMTSEVLKHEDTIRKHVSEFIDGDKDVPDHIKTIQNRTLKNGDVEGNWSVLSMHPHVLSHVIDNLLGDEAQTYRDALKGDLTINFGDQALEGVGTDGYRASTPTSYLSTHIGPEAAVKYNEIMSSTANDRERINAIEQHMEHLDNSGNEDESMYWGDILARVEAEHDSIGLKLDDPRPVYIAFNAGNDPSGGAVEYGDHHLSVKNPESILKHCTASIDDTFYETGSIPKVWNMDHLTDMMICKGLLSNSTAKSPQELIRTTKGMIPIEVQYHHQSMNNSMYDVKPYSK